MFLLIPKNNKRLLIFIFILLTGFSFYSLSRLYFFLTDGFSIGNITFDLPYRPELVTRNLTPEEETVVKEVLNQPFYYLGKGCQSYVFSSQDGQYVIKFFKYQRFKSKFLLDQFSFIPVIDRYKTNRNNHKHRKLFSFMKGCQIAFENLQQETGLVFAQLNKNANNKKRVTIYDKIGFKHEIELGGVEFLLQRKARMFTEEIDTLMAEGKKDEANKLIQMFINMVIKEHKRGIEDNDPAFIQNTGVINGKPIHIDVGQFAQYKSLEDKNGFYQRLLFKVDELRNWIEKTHPELLIPLEEKMTEVLSTQELAFRPHKSSCG